jgi:hypothetical protein
MIYGGRLEGIPPSFEEVVQGAALEEEADR